MTGATEIRREKTKIEYENCFESSWVTVIYNAGGIYFLGKSGFS